jgi:hypothetical protein
VVVVVVVVGYIGCGSHSARHGVSVVVMLVWGVGIAEGHVQSGQAW